MKRAIFCASVFFIFLGVSSVLAISYSSIEDNCKDLTTAQYKIYSNELEEQSVQLEGDVINVEKRFFSSSYNVTIDADGDSFADVVFSADESTAMGLKKGKTYNITGEIENVEREFGKCSLSLEQVTID
jgi:hypothetical protein